MMKKLMKCFLCEGRKVIYDPNSPRDPIEGNKMRGVASCPLCDGHAEFDIHRYLKPADIIGLYHEMLVNQVAETLKTTRENDIEEKVRKALSTIIRG